VEAHDAGMTSAKRNKGVALRNGGEHLVVTDKMGFLEDLDSV
jgi:hypothetical protein